MTGIPMKRRTLLSGALAAAALAVGPAAAQTVELEFPTWQAEEPGPADFWNEAVKAFEASHPGVKINKYQIPFKDYIDRTTVRFASKRPPDIVQLPTRNFAAFAQQGWLMPLDDLMAGTDIKQSYIPLQQEMVWEGKTQGVLLMAYGMVFFYNEKMLADAGVSVPKTPDDLLKAIKASTNSAAGTFGWGATTSEHPNIFVDWSTWATGLGASLFTKTGQYNLTDPKTVAAIDSFRQAVKSAPKGTSTETARQLFVDGKIAMMRDGPWVAALIAKAPDAVRPHLKVGAMPFPVVAGGTSNSIHIPVGLDPARQKLVWEFITMISRPDWQARYFKLVKAPSPRKDVASDAEVAKDPVLSLAMDAAGKAENLFPTAAAAQLGYAQIAKLVGEAGIRLVNTETPTETILKALQDELSRRVPIK